MPHTAVSVAKCHTSQGLMCTLLRHDRMQAAAACYLAAFLPLDEADQWQHVLNFLLLFCSIAHAGLGMRSCWPAVPPPIHALCCRQQAGHSQPPSAVEQEIGNMELVHSRLWLAAQQPQQCCRGCVTCAQHCSGVWRLACSSREHDKGTHKRGHAHAWCWLHECNEVEHTFLGWHGVREVSVGWTLWCHCLRLVNPWRLALCLLQLALQHMHQRLSGACSSLACQTV